MTYMVEHAAAMLHTLPLNATLNSFWSGHRTMGEVRLARRNTNRHRNLRDTYHSVERWAVGGGSMWVYMATVMRFGLPGHTC